MLGLKLYASMPGEIHIFMALRSESLSSRLYPVRTLGFLTFDSTFVSEGDETIPRFLPPPSSYERT